MDKLCDGIRKYGFGVKNYDKYLIERRSQAIDRKILWFVRNPDKLPERHADIIPLIDDYYQIIE